MTAWQQMLEIASDLDEAEECDRQLRTPLEVTGPESARDELVRRRELGHTAGCQCQSRPNLSCHELRQMVGWEVVELLFVDSGSERE